MLVMLTTYGVKQNGYAEMVNCDLTMDVLFELKVPNARL